MVYTNTKEFLEELTKLSRKYRIAISGCGCHGSPYLLPIDAKIDDAYYVADNDENLSFRTKEKDSYDYLYGDKYE